VDGTEKNGGGEAVKPIHQAEVTDGDRGEKDQTNPKELKEKG